MIDIKAEKRRYGFEAYKAKIAGDNDRADFYYSLYLGVGKISLNIGSDDPQAEKRYQEEREKERQLFAKYGERYDGIWHFTLNI
jgi:hypothetical protein